MTQAIDFPFLSLLFEVNICLNYVCKMVTLSFVLLLHKMSMIINWIEVMMIPSPTEGLSLKHLYPQKYMSYHREFTLETPIPIYVTFLNFEIVVFQSTTQSMNWSDSNCSEHQWYIVIWLLQHQTDNWTWGFKENWKWIENDVFDFFKLSPELMHWNRIFCSEYQWYNVAWLLQHHIWNRTWGIPREFQLNSKLTFWFFQNNAWIDGLKWFQLQWIWTILGDLIDITTVLMSILFWSWEFQELLFFDFQKVRNVT